MEEEKVQFMNKNLEYYENLVKKDNFNYYSKEGYQKLVIEIVSHWKKDKENLNNKGE